MTTNAYYNHTDSVPAPNSRGASALVSSEFDLIAAGFNALPSPSQLGGSTQNYAVDTGTVNAVAVAAPANVVAYADGLEMTFRALYTNTGSATINIGAIGAVPIVRPDGTPVQAGDYLIDQIVVVRYSSVDSAFQLTTIGPAVAANAATQAAAAAASATTATTEAGIATTEAGVATTQATAAAASAASAASAATTAAQAAAATIPQNSQSVNYTTVLGDAGKHIFHPVADANSRTFTIAANASVAYPIGTGITFVNMSVLALTIAIASDTLLMSPGGSAGNRTLAQYGVATAIKITATSWLIAGTGMT
jgi:hypothetical protein